MVSDPIYSKCSAGKTSDSRGSWCLHLFHCIAVTLERSLIASRRSQTNKNVFMRELFNDFRIATLIGVAVIFCALVIHRKYPYLCVVCLECAE